MSLVPCPDCGREVSELAPACPQCGRPIASPVDSAPRRVVTTEDSAMTRSRGCGDIVVFGPILLILLILVIVFAVASR